MTREKTYKINVCQEFMDVLDRLEMKIKTATWDGMNKVSKTTLTRVLARKINSSKIV